MSSAIYRDEGGRLTYIPCPSEFNSLCEEAILPAILDEQKQQDNLCIDEDDIPESKWLDTELEDYEIPEYSFTVEPNEAYDEHECISMLKDRGIHPYCQMQEVINAAVERILAKHPHARIQRVKEWDDAS